MRGWNGRPDSRTDKAGGAATTFNRRAVREFTGWSDYQVKIHIKPLEELEYLVPLSGRRGQMLLL